MTTQVETTVRSPEAFALAHRAVDAMQAAAVWPTPLNFELWLHYLSAPDSPLSQEMARLLASGAPFTDSTAEMLAAEFLPRSRLSEEIRDAGAVLNRELAAVAAAIDKARESQSAYGDTLADAADRMAQASDSNSLGVIVTSLSDATQRIRRHTTALERRLESSNREVVKLR